MANLLNTQGVGEIESPEQSGEVATETSQGGSVGTPNAPGVGGGFLAIGALLLFALIGGFFVIRARKKLLATETGAQSAGLLLDDMRAMLKRGEISQEEFDATRRSLGARLKAEAQAPAPSSKRPASP
jgi:hypothetical protein